MISMWLSYSNSSLSLNSSCVRFGPFISGHRFRIDGVYLLEQVGGLVPRQHVGSVRGQGADQVGPANAAGSLAVREDLERVLDLVPNGPCQSVV